jgi:CheY-like chemotaxis protein
MPNGSRTLWRCGRTTLKGKDVALVLVIDDEPLMRRMIRRSLEGEGHTVLEAEHGRIGMKIAQQRHPEIVITDILMPETEGIETIRSLRSSIPAVKILAISGAGELSGVSYLRIAGALGADDILAKPFRNDELTGAVARLLVLER